MMASCRKEVRFMQKERMRKAGHTRICDPHNWDGVNERYRSFFAMHWRAFPNLRDVTILPKKKGAHK